MAPRPAAEEGQATLEAALVLPILLLLIIGMVGVAQVLHASTMTVLAATRGARLAAVVYGNPSLTPEDQERQVTTAVEATLAAGLRGADYSITVMPAGDDVRVEVVYREALSLPWIHTILGDDTWTVGHVAVNRIEQQ